MLPLPGTPAFSWAMYRQKLEGVLGGSQVRVAAAFFVFGLLNNVFAVMIVSAALDLVGPHIPKGTVLFATILPGVTSKLFLPYVIHVVPYGWRVLACSVMSTVGMLLVALTPNYSSSSGIGSGSGGTAAFALSGTAVDFGAAVGLKILGIVLASISSGAGELSFLGLTHYYGNTGLAAWGSGTGGAGLVGAGVYALVTGPMGVSVRTTLLASAAWPFGMALAYFFVLPLGPMKRWRAGAASAAASHSPPSSAGGRVRSRPGAEAGGGDYEEDEEEEEEEESEAMARSDQGLLSGAPRTETADSSGSHDDDRSPPPALLSSFSANVRRARALFVPFMLPLFIVYVGEYTINQGISPTLLFPVPSPTNPFRHYREFYPAYATVYQTGVFVSRSSVFFPSLRLRALYPAALLQLANVALLAAQSALVLLPNVYLVWLVVFWEGLLGGAVYVNTFAQILERVPVRDREFSLGATSVSDSTGILVASLLGMALEVALCSYQVRTGRDYCTKL